MLHSDRHLENALSTLIWLTVIILFLITPKGSLSNTPFLINLRDPSCWQLLILPFSIHLTVAI
jgi:hypothetical protein